jgi:ankyrin repeat protein
VVGRPRRRLPLGVDPAAQTYRGWTALHYAAEHGHAGAAAYLARIPGVDIDAVARIDSNDPLKRSTAGVLALVERGCSLTEGRTRDGQGYLIVTAVAGHRPEIAIALIRCDRASESAPVKTIFIQAVMKHDEGVIAAIEERLDAEMREKCIEAARQARWE